ncbi:WapI family immunity protein [Erwinia sp. CGal63]|uniref:WapI family immunity protein n=1 Tax=Erwinia sp. CGal63 TaxID=2919889 RepID=UPI003008AD15
MFDFRNDNFTFTVSPFERVADREADPIEHLWDWIQCWIEFSVDGLKSQFQTEFTIGELKILRDSFSNHHEALIAQNDIKPFEFHSERHQLDMVLRKLNDVDSVIIEYILRPEAHADSVQVKGDFSINESYFPDILKRLDEMIAWQN